MEWYILVLKKEAKQGETKWTKNTKVKALNRIKKYGITKWHRKSFAPCKVKDED